MTSIKMPVSVLNLAPLRQGEGQKEAIDDMVALAQDVDQMGYNRFWIAEHHNAPNLASSATVVLINQVLNHTQNIQVGAGGIMLPNHVPLVVAEQFGTLETMYPGRVNLGLGRAPGTDMMTASALRRNQHESVYTFPDDVKALLDYLGPEIEQGYVKPYPGVDTNVPIFILGSSTDSAHLAARLGLPYVFAAHFAPDQMAEAFKIYRNLFTPSKYLDKPYAMAGLNVVVADTDEEAQFLASSLHLFFLGIIRNTRQPLQPPQENIEQYFSPQEMNMLKSRESYGLIGSKATVTEKLERFQEEYNVDEIIAVSYIFDREKQKKSFQLFKDITS